MKHFNFFTNRVVKSFRALALVAFVLLGTANALGETYTLVKSAPADWSGDYLIVAGTSALSGGTSSWGTFETVTVSGDDITTTSNIAVTISPGGTSGSYYIYQNSNSTYLKEVTSNTFATAATASTNTEWVISLNSGNAQIGCASTPTRLLRLNGTSGFRCYTSATGTLPKLYKKQAPSFNITASTNNASWGNVSISGSVITGSPAPGYGYASPAYTVTSGTATVSQSGNDFTVTPSSDCEVRINFEVLPTYTLTWNVNGSTSTTTTVVQGDAIGTLPTDPLSCSSTYSTFVGWYTVASGSESSPSASPAGTKITAATVPSGNTTYYAVFADGSMGGSWSKLTEDIQAGDVVIFVKESVPTEMTSVTTYGVVTNYATTPAGTYPLTVETGSSPGTFSFKNGSDYLSYTGSKNTLSTSTTKDGTSSWTMTRSGGDFKFTNVGSNTRQLTYNTGAPRWACYTTAQSVFQIYKQSASATGYISTCCTAITPTLSYSASVNVGQTLNPTLSGNTGSGAVTYSSSNTSVLTVNSSTGVVTGVGAGTATVTASIAASGSYCAGSATSSTITVNSGCSAATTSWASSSVTKVTTDANFTNTFTSNNTGAKTYSSSNTGVATVNATSGLVTIVGVGTTTISVTQPETSGICAVSESYLLTVNIPAYTVTFNAGTGSCGTASLTEASGGAGVTLPTASPSVGCAAETPAWQFVGWAAASQTETTSAPTLYTSGSTYNPSANVTLYAVYSQTTDGGTTPATTSISFSTVAGGWTKNLAQADGGDYWKLFESGDYFLSPSIDLSTITSVSATIGTYGGGTHTLSVQDESGNVWGTASSSNSAEAPTSVTKSGSLSGTGKVKFVCTTGSSSKGLRVQAITINYEESSSTTTYNSNPNCVVCDANTLALTSTTQTINIDGTGYAEYDVSTLITSKNGNGAVTYSVTPDDAIIDENTGEFITDTPGTYYVSVIQAIGSELPTPICAKTVKDTIVVLATPVVTIVDVTPLTFTANCGEASAAQSVSVTGYNLTANMTATAPTNFLVSSDDETYGPSATFTQTGGNASGTLYIKANPPAGSDNPISGNVSLTSTDATTRTLAVSATVSCTPVTVTFLDWDGTSTVWNTYYSGSTQTLPAPPTGACAGWTFSGWTTNNLTAISAGDIVGDAGQDVTLTGNTTYYAVYSQGGGTSTIFSDDFADLTTAQTTEVSRDNWQTLTKVYVEADPNNCQFKLGSKSAKGSATTVLMSELTGDGTLTFDLQLYGTDANNNVVVTINNGTITTASSATSSTSNTATYTISSTKTTHTIALNGGNTTSITFAAATASKNRFYLDNVSVVIGSGTYTLSPACCNINLVKPTVTTSSADHSVTVSWPSVKDAGVEAATAYKLTYKLASSPAVPTVVSVTATGAASYSHTITGLTNCSNYVFTVEAIGDPDADITICSSPIASVTTYPGVAYTVNYQYGAGTGTPNVWVSGCSNGTSTTLPEVTPNTLAYVFDGWYDGTTRVGGAGDSYTPTADVTLVAQYSAAPTYTLTFVNEGAEILTKTVYSTAVENDRKATEPNANYADYGLESTPLTTACSEAVFVGWTTTQTVAQGTTTSPTLVTFPYTISADATLYALWKITDTEGGSTATDFVKVTSTPSDWSGDYVIVSGTKAMKNTVSSGQMGASDVTISNNTISNPDASIIWTFTNTGTDTYSVYNEAVSKYAYITGTSSTNAGLSATTQNLTIGLKTAGDYDQIQVKGSGGTAARCFSYYSGSTAWRTYATSGNSTGSLYRRVAGTTTYYSSPVCTPMITVDPADVATCISAADLVVAVGGTATSTGHTVAARNCSGTSIVPVIIGTDRTSFSVDWTSAELTNGRIDTVYTVSYKPLTGSSHAAQLYFKTNDGIVLSDTIDLCGTVCTSAIFTTQSSDQSSITFAWASALPDAELHVWNDITGTPPCGPQPYNQTFVLGTETSKTITGLSASTTFHYQITNGGCVSEVRHVTTAAQTGLPVLTASPMLWETIAEANRPVTYTNTTINLTGANMPGANVSIALRGETAAFTLVPPATITLDGNGAGSIGVTYNPVKPQTNIAYIDLTYTSDCETKTVTITLVGNVPGIDIVEVNPDASGFTLHTDLEGTPNIVLSQEVEHQGDGRQANDLFFSKYFEAAQNTKLVGIYNGTNDTISLRGIRIAAQKAGGLTGTKAALWNPTDIISLDTLQSLAPGKEIILFSTTAGIQDMLVINCVAGSTGWEHEGWYPVNDQTATAVYGSSTRNLFKNGTYENKNAGIVTSGDKVYGLQRKAVDGTWEFIDVIGALHSTAQGDSVVGRKIKPSGTVTGMDAPGWACLDGTNYLTKETAGLSTNRHLLIRKNTVVDGLNALEQNTEDFATLCTEWEGLIVPKGGVGDLTEQEITCLHFGEVSTFNYDGYYASFERMDDNLVTFTAADGRPGDWVGSFLNPTETFQDSLRCYNLKISVERYYDTSKVPPVELTKAEVDQLDPIDDAEVIAALDTVEVMSTQYRVPILVMNGENLTTKDTRFTDLSVDTCRTCDVVIMNGGVLTKSNLTDDRDSVRSVFVYNGGRLVVPDGLDYSIQDLSIRAQGDAVGAAYVEGNLVMKNPRLYHDKLIDNAKWYFFTLPYSCPINRITEMNGKSLGVYGTTWSIAYYDGAERIINRGLSSNWKVLPSTEVLQPGVGYVIALASPTKKYVRFPMVVETEFTEKNTAKTLDVTQYGETQAAAGALGYNNVGWNLVGNPYIAYFTSDGSPTDGVNNGTINLAGYYSRSATGYDKTTWDRLDTDHVYVTIPKIGAPGYDQTLASTTQLNPFTSFFVQAQATGTLTFATTSRDQVAKVMRAPAVNYNEVVVNLDVAGQSDHTTIILDNERDLSYEIGKDLLKWKGSWSTAPYFYSYDNANSQLAFNAVNYDEAQTSIPLGFYMPTNNARYTFSLNKSASQLQNIEHVYLLRNGSVVADLLTTDYTGTDLRRTSDNRQFAISIQRAADVVTPLHPIEDGELMPRAITERHHVRLEQLPAEGTVMVIDAVGRTVAMRTLNGADHTTFELPVDGIYTISIVTPARNYILKTVIR